MPWRPAGRGAYGGGEWIEVAVTTNKDSYQLGIGVDARGRPVIENLSGRVMPSVNADFQHDLASSRHVARVVLALADIASCDGNDRWRHMGLAVSCWSSRSAGPAECLARLGPVRANPQMPRQLIELYPLSVKQERIAVDIARQLPALPESRQLLVQRRRFAHASGGRRFLPRLSRRQTR